MNGIACRSERSRAGVGEPSIAHAGRRADRRVGQHHRARNRGLFRRIVKEQGTTLLMATHDPLVDEYADLIVRLQDGQIMTAG